jgi:phospholipase/lecithinase/hemolysin
MSSHFGWPRRFAFAFTSAITVVAAGCSGSSSQPPPRQLPSVTTSIGRGGGQVTLASGPTLQIPDAALASTVAITIAQSAVIPPAGATSQVYEFGPDGTQFASSVAVSFQVPAGTADASIYWTLPGSTDYDVLPTTLNGTTVTAYVTHFSRGFWGPSCHHGDSCTPGNACHAGAKTCNGPRACLDAGTKVPDGTTCGSGGVCGSGACVTPCVAGQACTPGGTPNACKLYETTCDSTRTVTSCSEAGNAADGKTCGTGDVCSAGACISACVPSQACTPSGTADSCKAYETSCNATDTVTTCGVTGNTVDGTACGSGEVCSVGACIQACAANQPCTPTGTPVTCRVYETTCNGALTVTTCSVAATSPEGTTCGTGDVCSAAGACIAACVPGQACVPAGTPDPCKTYATTCNALATVTSCGILGSVADGTPCGSGGTCSAGACGTQTAVAISGSVSGAIISGVTVTLDAASVTSTDNSGHYSFSGVVNGNHTLAASKPGYAFSPGSRLATVNGSDSSGNDFQAFIVPAASTLYDDFSSGSIDGSRWQVGQYQALLRGSQALLSGSISNEWPTQSYVSKIVLVPPSSGGQVTSLQADVLVDSITTVTAPSLARAALDFWYQPRANRLAGDYSWDNLLIIRALLEQTSTEFRARYFAYECDSGSFDCWDGAVIGTGTGNWPSPVPLTIGTTYTVGVQVDPTTDIITFTCSGGSLPPGGLTENVDVSGITTAGGYPFTPDLSAENYFLARLISQVESNGGAGNGSITAHFDNVYLGQSGNAPTLFDDFNSGTTFDSSKWQVGGASAQVANSKLVLALDQADTAASTREVFLDTPATAIQADVTVNALSRIGTGNLVAQLRKTLYNDGTNGSGIAPDINEATSRVGDVLSAIDMSDTAVFSSVIRCDSAICDRYTFIQPLTSLGAVQLQTKHTLYVGWDAVNHIAIFQLDGDRAAAFDPTTSNPIAASTRVPEARLAVRAGDTSSTDHWTIGSSGSMTASFENIHTNGTPQANINYSQLVVFGDSSVDSGWYRSIGGSPTPNATWTSLWSAAVAAGAGVPTSSPGLVYPQVLAQQLGLHADPANQAGGTNYATSGAKNVDANTSANGGFQAAVPTVTQIANYLSAAGKADPKALYLISSGGNDVTFAAGASGTGPFPANPDQYLANAANALAQAITSLKAAGATHIVVANLASSFGTGTTPQLKAIYNQALFGALSGSGVSVTEADINSVRLQIAVNPSQYGFTSISNANTACAKPAGITSAWALLCSSSPSAPSTFVSPNADETLLFADDEHLATAGQRIIANYILGLVQ